MNYVENNVVIVRNTSLNIFVKKKRYAWHGLRVFDNIIPAVTTNMQVPQVRDMFVYIFFACCRHVLAEESAVGQFWFHEYEETIINTRQ